MSLLEVFCYRREDLHREGVLIDRLHCEMLAQNHGRIKQNTHIVVSLSSSIEDLERRFAKIREKLMPVEFPLTLRVVSVLWSRLTKKIVVRRYSFLRQPRIEMLQRAAIDSVIQGGPPGVFTYIETGLYIREL